MTRERPDTAAELRHAENKLLGWDTPPQHRACALQARDAEILGALGRYRFLTTVQIAELFWSQDAALQVVRRRMAKLHAAGYVERFRPQTIRGSYQWIYCLARDGHRAAQQAGELAAETRFTSRREQIFDYRYVVHDLRMNDWAIRFQQVAGGYCFRWYGPDECRAEPPRHDRNAVPLESRRGIHKLKLTTPRPIAPDASLELLRDKGRTVHLHVEYDRTRRVDKNFEKFWRYENFMCLWWQEDPTARRGMACVLFLCENEDHLDRFLSAADRELLAYRWTQAADGSGVPVFPARARTYFALTADIYAGSFRAFRVPLYPAGHDLGNPDDDYEEVALAGPGAP